MSYTIDPLLNTGIPVALGKRVIVEVEDGGEQKLGSLYIPEGAKDAPQHGIVRSIGPEFQADLIAEGLADPEQIVHIGDRVLFSRYAGNEVRLMAGKRLLFLDEGDVLAKLETD